MGKVEIKNTTIGYHTGKHATIVAEHISGSIGGGMLTCLIGPNGAGKSTLLKTLSGFIPPLKGSIIIDGEDISHYSPRQLSRNIGVVLTGRPAFINMTVAELVALGRNPYTGFWGSLSDEDKRVVDEALKLTGIEALKSRNISMLSDGEFQRAIIAKAVAQDTSVVLLDEPTSFLDFTSKVSIMRTLRKIAHATGNVAFLSTHDVSLALQLADQIWLMLPGSDIAIGTPQALAANGSLSLFLDKDGIEFDPKTLTMRVRAEE